MKIKKNKTRKKKTSLLFILLITIALLGILYYAFFVKGGIFGLNQMNSPHINYAPPTDQQKRAGQQKKEESIVNDTDDPQKESVDQSSVSDRDNPSITITSTNQNGSLMQIRSMISSITETGSCTLILTNQEGSKVTKESNVQAYPSYSTCKGFDVPITELNPGKWSILLTYVSATAEAKTNGNLEVK